MTNRKASDRMAECIIDLLHEYKRQIEMLNRKIDCLTTECKGYEKKLFKSVAQADNVSDVLGEIAEIIAGIIEHTADGYTRIYLNDLQPENVAKLKRLFKLLDIPMTADQIKEGVKDEEN